MNSFFKSAQYKRASSLLNIAVFERLGKQMHTKNEMTLLAGGVKRSKKENHQKILNEMKSNHVKEFSDRAVFEDTDSWIIFKDIYIAHIDCVRRNDSKYVTSVFRKMLRNDAFEEFLKNRWGVERVGRIRKIENKYVDQFFCSDFRDFSLKQFGMYDSFVKSKFANKFDKIIAKMSV